MTAHKELATVTWWIHNEEVAKSMLESIPNGSAENSAILRNRKEFLDLPKDNKLTDMHLQSGHIKNNKPLIRFMNKPHLKININPRTGKLKSIYGRLRWDCKKPAHNFSNG